MTLEARSNIIVHMKTKGERRCGRMRMGAARRIAAALLSVVFIAELTGCVDPREARRELFAMDTYMELRAYGEGSDGALSLAEDVIKQLDGLLSATDERSELSKINRSHGEPVSVSAETLDALSEALAISGKVGGALELSLRPVTLAWGFTTGEYRVPTEEELAELLPLVDDGKVVLDEAALTVTLPEGMMLDLGSVAKGYACDRAAETLSEAGVSGMLLNMGSSTILARGSKPDGSKWRIAVRDPEGGYAGYIDTDGACVSTSGGAERFFTGDDGEIYWHIIDPATGRPAKNGALAVTVVTESALWGDALSTALFVMGSDKAKEFYNKDKSFEYLFIMEDGSLILSTGMEGMFTPLGRFAESGAASQ